MEPTNQATAILAAGLLVALTAATIGCWNRWRRVLRWPARLLSLSLCQLMAVAVAGLFLNAQYDFYGSWAELAGQSPTMSTAGAAVGNLDGAVRTELARAGARGHGIVVPLTIDGTLSHVRPLRASVYLPPQYGQAANAHRRFPVVELLGGYPGGPQTWTGILHISETLDSEIKAGRTEPMIAVIPTMNVASPRDTECVNVPGGPQAATYLTADVRAAVSRAFRAETTGRQWALLGYSTGGYCAAMLASEYPSMFGAVTSLEGYNGAALDRSTGALFRGSTTLRQQHDLLWRLHEGLVPSLPMLFVSTKQDRLSYRDDRRLDAAAPARYPIYQLTLPRGAHNKSTFVAEIPVGLGWISHYLGPALAPAPVIDGLTPQLAATTRAPAPRHSKKVLTQQKG